jgi:two-component system response regulator AtoC
MITELSLCRSEAMQSVADLVAKVAATTATILLRGESGVGKEIVARAVHTASPRAKQPFVKVNCAALPGELLESELFGHERGAFTGAYREKPGKFEIAHRGTLFLDEIGELPLGLQAKLLHVLQDGEFARVGGARLLRRDVRIVAATNADLEAAIAAGRFREDLYYRLKVIEVRIPPLRERREEIPALVEHFMAKFEREYGRQLPLSPPAMQALVEYDWPGNVRELENVLKRAIVLDNVDTIERGLTARSTGPRPAAGASAPAVAATVVALPPMGLKEIARQAARDAERAAIKDVLERVHWNRTKAARMLQISYKAMLYKIVDCGLTSPTSVSEEISEEMVA